MASIFISYRRDDSEGQAGRLFEKLSDRFGRDKVFLDVVGIGTGIDFRVEIDRKVSSCDLLIAVIGKNWLLSKDKNGKRRVDSPSDFVRLEIAAALKRDIPVVPVFVQGATMPSEEDLPENLRPLVYRNGIELTHAKWDSDVELLVQAIKRALGKNSLGGPVVPRTNMLWRWPMLIVLLTAVFGAGIYWNIHSLRQADRTAPFRDGNTTSNAQDTRVNPSIASGATAEAIKDAAGKAADAAKEAAGRAADAAKDAPRRDESGQTSDTGKDAAQKAADAAKDAAGKAADAVRK